MPLVIHLSLGDPIDTWAWQALERIQEQLVADIRTLQFNCRHFRLGVKRNASVGYGSMLCKAGNTWGKNHPHKRCWKVTDCTNLECRKEKIH